MFIRILGSAAGGGVPQWNCACRNCAAARAGSPDVRPRTQSSVAVSADGRSWVLLNVSPDVRQQILAFPPLGPPEGTQRGTSIAGCVLTDAELDHTAGLLLLREGATFPIFCTGTVRQWLNDQWPVEPLLACFSNPRWREISDAFIEFFTSSCDSRLRVRAVELDDHAPRFARKETGTSTAAVIGLDIEDTRTRGRLFYAPGVAALGPALLQVAETADAVLIDGTFWDNEEPTRCGITSGTAQMMGHLPVSGLGGSLEWLSKLKARHRVYVHINNTNPMLNERGPEFREVSACGVRVGADGDRFEV